MGPSPFFDHIPDNIIRWIQKQHIFYVATAPTSTDGHLNISPKGLQGTFHVENANRVWYEDLSGTGIETIAHIRENRRVTVMFASFEGAPRIVRLYGHGTIYEFGTPEYEVLIPESSRKPGCRAAIVIDVYKVGSSCGWSVPYYEYKAPRKILMEKFAKKEAKEEVKEFWLQYNMSSLDGLPGITSAPHSDVTLKSLDVKTIAANEGGGEGIKSSIVSHDVAKRKDTMNLKLIMAFSFGALISAIFGQLMRVA